MNRPLSSLMQMLNLMMIQLGVLHNRLVYQEEIRQCDEELRRISRSHPSKWRKRRRALEERKRAFRKALAAEFTDFHLNQAVINRHLGDLALHLAARARQGSRG